MGRGQRKGAGYTKLPEITVKDKGASRSEAYQSEGPQYPLTPAQKK